MNLSELIKEKRKISDNIKNLYSLPKKNKAVGLIKLDDSNLANELQEGLKELPANFIIEWSNIEDKWYNNIAISDNTSKLEYGFDFIVCDNCTDRLNELFSKWIVPIIIKDSHISSLLKEFNPIKNEWNSYMFEKDEKWNIFYAIVRYLENYKFPFDNKNLVKNISEM